MQLPVSFEAVLKSRIPVIQEICEISGQTGVSIGVLQGDEKFVYNVGYRDVENMITPDENTLYCIGSCTKAFTAAALGVIVDENPQQINWETKLSSIYPSIQSSADPVVAERSTLRDILSHHTGLAGMDTLWQGIGNQITLDKYKVVDAVNALSRLRDFRSGFVYNNILYSMAGNIVEKYGGEDAAEGWAEFLKRRILKPLRMTRTTASLEDLKSDFNVAKPYMVVLDKTPVEINQPAASADTLIGSAGGLRSSVHDMLIWGKSLLAAHSAEVNRVSPGDSNPLRQMRSQLGFSSAVKPDCATQEFYGFGFYNQRLPTKLGPWSVNRDYVTPENVPTMSAQTRIVSSTGDQTFQVFSHGGLIAGFTTSFYLVPFKNTVVVVLSNSNSHGDSADLIAQDLIQALFHFKPPVDYIQQAKNTAAGFKEWFKEALQIPYDENKGDNGTCPPPSLECFEGLYRLSTLPSFNLRIEKISGKHGIPSLRMIVNDEYTQVHVLEHYNHNVWSFLPKTYNDYLKTGYLAWSTLEEFLIKFERDALGKIVRVEWEMAGTALKFEKAEQEQ
ncbi:beta-lactamase/transpeptidase-like protein [Geopyxis carbonaria]|nr:beta-lactamase/transpeptidase-like protein [Geopyxis carbonaria]